MVLSYMHILKKIYLKNYVSAESDGWLLGGYAFFFFHYIIFLGISLSATHLSDLTLTIVANIVWSLMNFYYKTYYIIFTNKHLNTDQLVRLMVLHYLTPWYYLYLVQLHAMFCHESWDSDSGEGTLEDKSGVYISWFYDALLKEIQDAWYWTLFVFVYFWMHHLSPLTVNYFFFRTLKYKGTWRNTILRCCTSLIFPTLYGFTSSNPHTLRRFNVNGFMARPFSCFAYPLCML
jgi:hypothetical protein